MCLKFVSEEWKLNHHFQPVCCCGARLQGPASALFSIIRMIINAFFGAAASRGTRIDCLVFGNRFRECGAQCLAPATIDPDVAKKSATT
jgi:hypothetical protein